MSLLSSRRRPWPFHMRMGSIVGSVDDRIGLMLVPNEQGLMVAKKQQMLDQVVPSQQEYGSAPVYRERTFTAKPTGGYGERVQSSYGDKRYYWGMDVWVQGGLFGKGPLLHPIAPSTAAGGEVFKFVEGFDTAGNTPTQFILAGQRVYRRTNDTNAGQVVDRDFGAGGGVWDGVVFQGGFAGATKSLYVATYTTSQIWERTPAGTWTQCALPSGFLPSRLEVVGTELWAADIGNSVVRKVTSDPKVAANWSGPIFVGDPTARITSLRQTGNQLVIFKEDGTLFTLNSDGTVNDLFPGLAGPFNYDNGRRAQAWLNAIWFYDNNTFYRLTMPGAELEQIGPGKLLDNASPVRGTARVFCGWSGYQGFLGIYNATDNISYLLTYGSWEMKQTDDGTQTVWDDQWDGAIAHWNGKSISALGVSGVSGNDRLYIGFSDGTWDWIKLVPTPLATGSGAEFNLGPAELVLPLHTAMFQADTKHWLGFSLFGPVMRVGDEATVSYRIMASAGAPPTDPTGNWLELGDFTQNGQRIDAPPNLAGNAIQLKVALTNSNQATTPVIEVISIHERVVPAFKRDLQMTIDARGFQTRLDGAALRFNSDVMHQAMLDFAAVPGSLAIELPDETVNEVAVFGYGERMLPMQAGGGRSWAIDIQATQFRVLTRYGIVSRLRGTRVGDLRGYTVGSLRTL